MRRSSRYMGRDSKDILRGLCKHLPEVNIYREKQGVPFLFLDNVYSLGYGIRLFSDSGDPFDTSDYPSLVVRKNNGSTPILDSKMEEILNESLPNVERAFFLDYYNDVSRWTYKYHDSIWGKLGKRIIKAYMKTYMKDKIDSDLL